jgi:hypothetical protein
MCCQKKLAYHQQPGKISQYQIRTRSGTLTKKNDDYENNHADFLSNRAAYQQQL